MPEGRTALCCAASVGGGLGVLAKQSCPGEVSAMLPLVCYIQLCPEQLREVETDPKTHAALWTS
jgi:hypothetical protein